MRKTDCNDTKSENWKLEKIGKIENRKVLKIWSRHYVDIETNECSKGEPVAVGDLMASFCKFTTFQNVPKVDQLSHSEVKHPLVAGWKELWKMNASF